MKDRYLFTKGLIKVFEYVLKAHSEGTQESSKRFWGGILITNAIAMAWTNNSNYTMILSVGVALIAAGLIESFRTKKIS